jgi:hypothetical protein
MEAPELWAFASTKPVCLYKTGLPLRKNFDSTKKDPLLNWYQIKFI